MWNLATAAMRLAATIMLVAGCSMVVAALSAGLFPDAPIARTMASSALQIGAVFLAGGAAVRYLSGASAGLQLPNERTTVSDGDRPSLDGWLIALPVVLVAAPVWLVLQLRPFLAEWRRVIDLIRTSEIWDNASGAGLVLVPIGVALSPAAIELAAATAVVLASALLLTLLLRRSPQFPRGYLVCMVLLTSLVLASLRAADAGLAAADAVRSLVEESKAGPEEAAQLMEVLRRYTGAVGPAAPALLWALAALLVWLPLIVMSTRARFVFAVPAEPPAPPRSRLASLESVTRPPRSPQ